MIGAATLARKASKVILKSKALVMPVAARSVTTASSTVKPSPWEVVPMGPPDPILGLTEAFKKDTDERKISLGVGAYRDNNGAPVVLNTVRKAEDYVIRSNMDHEYAGIAGIPGFVKLALEFAYGSDSPALVDGRVAAVQSLSGTGACRAFGEFLATFIGRGSAIYVPDPTWGNHIPVFKNSGLDVKRYRYYDPKTCGLDFDGLMEDVSSAPNGTAFILHACAHNPTGVDPTQAQWRELSSLMLSKKHIVFMDCAYQGFASGDAVKDAFSIRQFVSDGHNIGLSQSFAKNFGLYGERIGTLSIVCSDKEEKSRVESQMKRIVRPMWSNPPIHGARIVSHILSNPALAEEWKHECKTMADRISHMRSELKRNIEELGSKRSWNHVTDQIGMFCYTGLDKDAVLRIRKERHIYFTDDGRISMAGLNDSNVKYVAEAIVWASG